VIGRILNTFGTRSLSAVINLLIAVMVSQYLGPEGKGSQGIIITTVAFILVFSNLVGGATLVYLVPRHRYSLLLLPSYMWALATGITAYLFLSISGVVDREFILHICLLSVVNAFTNIHAGMLIGREKIRESNLISLLQPLIVILSLAIYFMLMDKLTIGAYINALYFAFSGSLLLSLVYMGKSFDRMMLHTAQEYLATSREMFRLGFMNQAAHITQMMSFRLSYYFLEMYHGSASVGIYSNGIQLMESVWLISKSISLVQYARISNTTDRAYAQDLTAQMFKAGFFISLLCILPLVLVPGQFYLLIFGPGFLGVKEVILVLAPGVLIYNFSIILGHYFSGTGRYHVNTIASVAGLAVSLALFITLIPPFGGMGAGIATSLSYAVTSLVVLVFFLRDGVKATAFLPSAADIRILKQLTGKMKF
jgi:O-antigen/teichoic acid export membrane protein